jgi:hypothetical protein
MHEQVIRLLSIATPDSLAPHNNATGCKRVLHKDLAVLPSRTYGDRGRNQAKLRRLLVKRH